MKRVFDGKQNKGASVKECFGCGCACNPHTGALGSNKPVTQVKR